MTSDNRRPRTSSQSETVSGKAPSALRTIGYVSGVLAATGAAAVVGMNVSQRSTAATGTPIVSESRPLGSLTTGLVPGNKSSQVAQADSGEEMANLAAQEDDSDSTNGKADVHTLESIYALVQDHYVDQLPDDSKMSRGAVRAMISSLNDPDSQFLEPEQRSLIEAEANGTFAGIGAVTTIRGQKKDGYTEYKIVVVDPLPGSPAAKAGLKSGDTITHVDSKWVLGSDPFLKANKLYQKLSSRDKNDEDAFRKEFDEAKKRALGGIGLLPAQMLLRKGTTEKRVLTIQRPGAAAPLKITMENALTQVAPVTTSAAPSGKATVVKISLFTEKTAGEVKTALAKVPKGQGVVLDLRGNPGGDVTDAGSVGGLLAPNQPFALQIGAGGKRTRLAGSAGSLPKHPLVVLVDKGTARGAEALAASLQDSGSATLVGGRTFGDGISRSLYKLRDGSGFVLTTGKLISPKGYDWQLANGLVLRVALLPGMTEDQIVAKAVAVLQNPPRNVAAVSPASPTKIQP